METALMIRELIVAFIVIIALKWGADIVEALHIHDDYHEDIDNHLTGDVLDENVKNELLYDAYKECNDELLRMQRYN